MKGFTLIELIIVVAIIGIVAAIVIPVFSGQSSCEAQGYTWEDNKCYK